MSDAERRLSEIAFNYAAKNETPSGIAVSGVSDSLAMLYLLAEKGWPLEAVTVDHQLRAGSAHEARRVAEHCAKLNIPHTILNWDSPDQTGNLQDNARRARYRLMIDWAKSRGINSIALGHTMDDQAETFLMRLARGSGIDGLSGMSAHREENGITFLRPFLTARREELREYLRDRKIEWIEDPSNEDARFERVKARKALKILAPLGIDAAKIWQSTFHLDQIRRDLNLTVRDAFQDHGLNDKGDLVVGPDFQSAIKDETWHRFLAAALRFLSGADYPPRSDAIAELSYSIMKTRQHTLSGCIVTSSDSEVRITREHNAVKTLTTATDQLWDGRWQLDGPHDKTLEIRALGEAVKDTPWRDTGMPRTSLLATPAIWQGETLIAAPIAGLSNGWTAEATGRGKFADFILAR